MSGPITKKYMIIRWDEDQPDYLRIYTNDRGWITTMLRFIPGREKKKPHFFRDKINGRRDLYFQLPLPAFKGTGGINRFQGLHIPPDLRVQKALWVAKARAARKNAKQKPLPNSDDLIDQISKNLENTDD